jgi:predicted ArsR family transcriptional regulator
VTIIESNISIGRVFYALSDATRRQLLENLLAHDGQRPVDLKVKFPISRQAVLKHLHVLEEAGLVTAERTAGETIFHLNRAPLQQVQQGWLAQFTELASRVDLRCSAEVE